MASNKIRELRKAAGLTQEQLSARLDIKRATLARYEAGTIDPPTSQLQRIAKELGVTVNDLINDWSTVDKEEFKDVFIYGGQISQTVDYMRQLNLEGRQKVEIYAQDMTKIPEYQLQHPQEGPQAAPAAEEGTDTTHTQNAPEKPPGGKAE